MLRKYTVKSLRVLRSASHAVNDNHEQIAAGAAWRIGLPRQTVKTFIRLKFRFRHK